MMGRLGLEPRALALKAIKDDFSIGLILRRFPRFHKQEKRLESSRDSIGSDEKCLF
jgi:hypothetical protein